MKKSTLLIVLLCFISSCDRINSEEAGDQNEEIVLTKQEKLVALYQNSVVPLFEDFDKLNIPDSIKIDEKDASVDAGAAYGYIEVSQGLVDLENEPIQTFVLAHEVSHIATLAQASHFNLHGEIPRGTVTNDYKKAEYLADLIAVHLILKKLPQEFEKLASELNSFETLLGNGSFTHPSGASRLASLERYIEAAQEDDDEVSFKDRFVDIWEME